jgi:hypothetical protein
MISRHILFYAMTALFLVMFVSTMQAQDSVRYGFKGIELKMTKAEVTTVVRSTQWTSDEMEIYDTVSEDWVYLLDESGDTRTDRDPSAMMGVGCTELYGDTWCPRFYMAAISFAKGKLNEIELLAAEPRAFTELNTFCQLLINGISEKYGKPSKQMSDANIKTMKPGREVLALWKRDSQQIVISLERSKRTDRPYTFIVYITDLSNQPDRKPDF